MKRLITALLFTAIVCHAQVSVELVNLRAPTGTVATVDSIAGNPFDLIGVPDALGGPQLRWMDGATLGGHRIGNVAGPYGRTVKAGNVSADNGAAFLSAYGELAALTEATNGTKRILYLEPGDYDIGNTNFYFKKNIHVVCPQAMADYSGRRSATGGGSSGYLLQRAYIKSDSGIFSVTNDATGPLILSGLGLSQLTLEKATENLGLLNCNISTLLVKESASGRCAIRGGVVGDIIREGDGQLAAYGSFNYTIFKDVFFPGSIETSMASDDETISGCYFGGSTNFIGGAGFWSGEAFKAHFKDCVFNASGPMFDFTEYDPIALDLTFADCEFQSTGTNWFGDYAPTAGQVEFMNCKGVYSGLTNNSNIAIHFCVDENGNQLPFQ